MMELLFDGRILTHTTYTGVENYAKNLLDAFKSKLSINIAQPKTTNRYLAHLWTHLILPFKSGDILFCPANIAPVFVPKSKKLVVTIHDVAFLTYPKSFSRLFRFYYKLIMPIIIQRADKIITVSEYSKQEIEEFYPKAKGKIEVIYLGLNEKFKKSDNRIKKKQILYVGSMNERKNFKSIINAFELFDNREYKLLMVGNFSSNFALDDESISVLEQAKKNVNIELRSGVGDDELIMLYNESRLFVFSSFYEGFGLPILEAMACGTPVICSNVTSIPEVGGDAVVYCDPYRVEDIKEKIKLVLYNEVLQKDMIQKGLQRVKTFSWENSAAEHLKVFNKVLES